MNLPLPKLFFLALLFGIILNLSSLQAQCNSNQNQVVVILTTDNYGSETYWTLTSAAGGFYHRGDSFANATTYRDTFCVPRDTCMRFTIFDRYGDGMCCAYGQGAYLLLVNGDTVARGGSFTQNQSTDFACPPGMRCTAPDTVTLDTYQTAFDDHWYYFVPSTNGIYQISTCGLGNTCDTKIWVYDNCGSLIGETHAGTILFDDNDGGCGQLAVVTGMMQAGVPYYIRIGDHNDNCTAPIRWSLNYSGPIRGCLDPAACNYNPLATLTDTCIYPGHPNCPTGPDLVLLQNVLRNSLMMANYNSTDPCAVNEQCIAGLGPRKLIRFTTHIENNGTQDYFVGNPTSNPSQFNRMNCHGHYHYEGYAEYLLFDAFGNRIPVGFKNGFCVMDLVCQNGGTFQYGCSNMGISAGCGDIYDRGLDCQWIDVTDVPDGRYTFVARVNWDYSPDALGRYETDYENNWATACIVLSRASGQLQFTQDTTCGQYVDCAGRAFGTAERDCNGICNGGARRGDLDGNALRNQTDLNAYINGILGQNLNAVECNDLHRDSTLNVYDVALLNRCMRDSNRCQFPTGLVNIFDTVGLRIENVNLQQGYLDIAVRNPTTKMLGYQFKMSGIVVDSVQSLQSSSLYPVDLRSSASTNIIMGFSAVDSFVQRSSNPQSLCRVYFSQITGTEICIDSIYGIVNNLYQITENRIEGTCFLVPPTSIQSQTSQAFTLQVAPNPAKNSTVFQFGNLGDQAISLELMDATGRILRSYPQLNQRQFLLQREGLSPGVYYYRAASRSQTLVGKLIFE
jgi:hypothetical protein